MTDEEIIEIYRKHASTGWAHCGAWIARTYAAFFAWVVTYAILAISAILGGQDWVAWLLPIPVVVHLVTGYLCAKMEAKEFGEVTDE